MDARLMISMGGLAANGVYSLGCGWLCSGAAARADEKDKFPLSTGEARGGLFIAPVFGMMLGAGTVCIADRLLPWSYTKLPSFAATASIASLGMWLNAVGWFKSGEERKVTQFADSLFNLFAIGVWAGYYGMRRLF